MKVILSDTSPVSALFRLGKLDLLRDLYGVVLIPPAVFAELLNLSVFGYDLDPLTTASWLKVTVPKDQMLVGQLCRDLDIGEAEAIALAKELGAHLLIIDEKQGRQIAQSMDLPIIGLLGVLLAGKKAGLVDTLSPLLQRLGDIGFYISNRLTGEVLKQAGEDN